MELDPGTPGSQPEPKAGTNPLSHPGIPFFHILILISPGVSREGHFLTFLSVCSAVWTKMKQEAGTASGRSSLSGILAPPGSPQRKAEPSSMGRAFPAGAFSRRAWTVPLLPRVSPWKSGVPSFPGLPYKRSPSGRHLRRAGPARPPQLGSEGRERPTVSIESLKRKNGHGVGGRAVGTIGRVTADRAAWVGGKREEAMCRRAGGEIRARPVETERAVVDGAEESGCGKGSGCLKAETKAANRLLAG